MSTLPQHIQWRSRWAACWGHSLLRALATPMPWAPSSGSSTVSRSSPDAGSLRPRTPDDWHSSAHMLWAALVLLRTAPAELGGQLCQALTEALRRRWRGGAIGVEADHLRTEPGAGRPFGWAWTVMLAAEARRHQIAAEQGWATQLGELADAVRVNLLNALPRMGSPVRLGTEQNTAFSMGLLLDAFWTLGDSRTANALSDRARSLFGGQERSSSAVDPGTADICSPALAQADLVRRVLPPSVFSQWLAGFLPRLGSPRDATLQVPVLRRGAGGGTSPLPALSLTRALHLRRLAPHLQRARTELMIRSADRLLEDSAPLIATAPVTAAHLLVPLAVLTVTDC